MITQIPPYRATSSSSSAPILPWLLPEFDDLDPPDLALWSDYLRSGGDPNQIEIQHAFGNSLIVMTFQGLECRCYNNQLREFSEFIDLLLTAGANPNEIADECRIIANGEETILSNVTCLHILYLFWKLNRWSEEQDHYLEETFDRMINDPRVDLRAIFSEEYSSRDPDWDSARHGDDSRFHVSLRNLIEDATLLHYAAMLGDAQTIDKLLVRDPGLIHLPCFTVEGKNLLGVSKASHKPRMTEDPGKGILYPAVKTRALGIIAICGSGVKDPHVFSVTRYGRITALHLAARELKSEACLYLVGRDAYRGAEAEEEGARSTPLDFLKRAYKGWIDAGGYGVNWEKFDFIAPHKFKKLQSLLKFLPQIPKSLPQPYLWRHFNGYSILYDARTKVAMAAYECLTRESFKKQAERKGLSFTQDREIPPPNRSKNTDYLNSGYQRGHFRPAADATETTEAMRETFKYSNVFPQNPRLNMGCWSQLEQRVRELTLNHDFVEVFTGAFNLPTIGVDGKKRISYEVIGSGHVAVPSHLYKVLFLRNGLRESSLAYLFPNEPPPPGKGVDSFRVPVDTIQGLSGILFSSWIRKEITPTGFRILPTIQFETEELSSQIETLTLNPEFQLEDGLYQAKLTAGSGACLLHALLGEERGGTYSYGDDDQAARQRFSEVIRSGFEHPSEALIAAFTKLLQELKDGGLEFMRNRQIWEKQAGYAAHLRPLFEQLSGLEARRKAESEQEIERLTNFCKLLLVSTKPQSRLKTIIAQNDSLPASDQEWKAACTERRSDLIHYFNQRTFTRSNNIERQTAIRASSQRLSEIDTEIQSAKDRFIALARTEEVQAIYRNLILDPDFWFTDSDATIIAILYDLNIHFHKRAGEGIEPALAPIQPNGSHKRVIFWESIGGKGHHFWRCEIKI